MNKSPDIENFIEVTKRDLEKKIADMITDKEITSILEGRKRLHPLLAHLAFKVCTQGKETPQQYQRALEGGVVIELAHVASLAHDDTVDEDRRRWRKNSFGVKNGTAKAILTGHKMLISGFNIALKHGEEWAKLYVNSWNETLNGELDKKEQNKNGLKTAAQFSSVCKAGAMEANMLGDVLELFGKYGREIGLAYKFANDLVELANEKNKIRIDSLKKIGIKRKIPKIKDKTQEMYIEEIKKYVQKAEDLGSSKMIPDSPYKNMLTGFPRYIINERLKEIDIAI